MDLFDWAIVGMIGLFIFAFIMECLNFPNRVYNIHKEHGYFRLPGVTKKLKK